MTDQSTPMIPLYSVPRVGVGVMIFKDNKILLGQRHGAHGVGEYAFPGGHLEHMESFTDCAVRETAEECGVEITNIRFQLVANVQKYAPRHYIHIGVIADWLAGEPQLLEPDKCLSWAWYGFDELPQPMFEMCRLAVEAYKSGQQFIDSI